MNNTTKTILGLIVAVLVVWGGYALYDKQISEPTEGETIKIGVILPLTGSAAFVGEELKNGIDLASKEFGNQIELFIEDSGSNPKDGVSAFNKLENTVKPDIYISALSSVSMAITSLAEQNKVAVINIVATVPNLTEQGKHIFRYYPTAKDEIPLIVEMLENNNITKIGIIYLNDDFGNSVNQELKDKFEIIGGEVISEAFLISETDFKSHITKLKAKKTEALLAVGFDSHLKNIYTRANELKLGGKLFGLSTLSMPHLRDQLGGILEDAWILAPKIYDGTFVSSQKFMADYENMYKKEASHYAANSYDVLKLIIKIFDLEKMSKRNDVLNNFDSLVSYDGVFGSLKIDKQNREISFPLYQTKIKNGMLEYLVTQQTN